LRGRRESGSEEERESFFSSFNSGFFDDWKRWKVHLLSRVRVDDAVVEFRADDAVDGE
jgi:hypothetical protein